MVAVAKELSAQLHQSLSSTLLLEELASTEQVFLQLEHSNHITEVLVLGVRVEEPVSIAQRVHGYGKDIPILILSSPNHANQLRQALQFSPFVGNEVRVWSIDSTDDLPSALLNTVARTEKRREFRGTIQAAQHHLRELTREPVHLTHYLDRLLDRAPVGLMNVEASGKILSLNRRGCQILGRTERDAVGMPIEALFPLHERGKFKSMMARLVAPLKRHPAEVLELNTSSNTPTFLELEATSMADRSGQLGATIIFQDVTARVHAESERAQAEEELRKSESQLRLVTDALPVLISYVDTEDRYRFNNEAYEDWFGRPRESISGCHVRDVIGDAAYAVMQPYLQAAFSGQPVGFEATLPYRNRGERHVQGNVVPDVSDSGEVRGVVTVVSDITERKQAEERERQHMLELAHVSRVTTLGEMSSQLAHELAQPLMAIANFSEASLRTIKANAASWEDMEESLTDILEQAYRARDIIVQLRNFVRKNELQRASEDLNEVVRGIVRLARVETRWHNLNLRLNLARSLPSVRIDRTLVEQVVLNLIHNAVEALQTVQRDRMRLEIATTYNGNGAVELAVSDNGPGLPQETRRIFEPFFTTKGEGMGMGLAISRSIVDAHDGRLWASNNDDGGATFRFSLAAEATGGEDDDGA